VSKQRRWIAPAVGLLTVLGLALAPHLMVPVMAQGGPELERGRYMVVTGHCNNCHTSGYTKAEGNLPEKQWLTGSGALGYRGPWGTTYSSNLRLTVQTFTEDEWVKYAKSLKSKPPMPWWSLRDTSEQDLRAMYKYIKHLGPAGEPAKAWVPPDKDPDKPYEFRQLIQ
jgi:mono/diheme cytochrome c family protein